LSRDVTFDETSMMKLINSQQVESDATLCTPGSSVSFEIPLTVIRDENQVANDDTEDIENQ